MAGDPFDPAIAAAVAGVDEAVALAALDSLLAVDLVRLDGAPAALSLSPSARPPCGVRVRRRRLAARGARTRRGGAGGAWRDAGRARAPRRARGTRRRSRRGGTARARGRADAAVGAGDRRGLVRGGVAAAAERCRARPAAAGAAARTGRGAGLRRESRSRRATRCAACSRCCRPMPRTGARAWPSKLAELEALWTQEPEAARRLLEGERAALGNIAPGRRGGAHARDGDRAQRARRLRGRARVGRAGAARRAGGR